jgi:hypothetical protein
MLAVLACFSCPYLAIGTCTTIADGGLVEGGELDGDSLPSD